MAEMITGHSIRGASSPCQASLRFFDGFRAHDGFVPKGTLFVVYVMRLNQSGCFLLPPTQVEALHAPEMFGELPSDAVFARPILMTGDLPPFLTL